MLLHNWQCNRFAYTSITSDTWVMHHDMTLWQLQCHWAIEIFRLHYKLMGPQWSLWFIVDPNVTIPSPVQEDRDYGCHFQHHQPSAQSCTWRPQERFVRWVSDKSRGLMEVSTPTAQSLPPHSTLPWWLKHLSGSPGQVGTVLGHVARAPGNPTPLLKLWSFFEVGLQGTARSEERMQSLGPGLHRHQEYPQGLCHRTRASIPASHYGRQTACSLQ